MNPTAYAPPRLIFWESTQPYIGLHPLPLLPITDQLLPRT